MAIDKSNVDENYNELMNLMSVQPINHSHYFQTMLKVKELLKRIDLEAYNRGFKHAVEIEFKKPI
jgi:hypothetical protein